MEQTFRVASESVHARGKHGNLYVRRRIPAAIRAAYPAHQEHIVRRLGTSDRGAAKELARAEDTRIDIEFRQKRQELDLSRASLSAKRIAKLDDEQPRGLALQGARGRSPSRRELDPSGPARRRLLHRAQGQPAWTGVHQESGELRAQGRAAAGRLDDLTRLKA